MRLPARSKRLPARSKRLTEVLETPWVLDPENKISIRGLDFRTLILQVNADGLTQDEAEEVAGYVVGVINHFRGFHLNYEPK